MNNILCCNAGRRGRLMIDMRKTIGDSGNVVATDNWSVAPAIFFANKQYVVPKITHPNYIQEVLGICKKEDIKAIFTLIDPEIDLLASNKKKFTEFHLDDAHTLYPAILIDKNFRRILQQIKNDSLFFCRWPRKSLGSWPYRV